MSAMSPAPGLHVPRHLPGTETAARVRTNGTFMRVELDQLVSTAVTMPRRALRDPATWARFRAYPEPHRGAVCALAAAGLTVAQMRDVTLADVGVRGSTVTVAGRTVPVEAEAQVFVRAQLLLREPETLARPAAVLLPAGNGRRTTETALARVITEARRELGVAVNPVRMDRKRVTGTRWALRWGLKLHGLRS